MLTLERWKVLRRANLSKKINSETYVSRHVWPGINRIKSVERVCKLDSRMRLWVRSIGPFQCRKIRSKTLLSFWIPTVISALHPTSALWINLFYIDKRGSLVYLCLIFRFKSQTSLQNRVVFVISFIRIFSKRNWGRNLNFASLAQLLLENLLIFIVLYCDAIFLP